jgi:hypothetical protein
MRKVNAIYYRIPTLFQKRAWRVTKIEKEFEAKTLKEAIKVAVNNKIKDFYLFGIEQL